MPALFSPRATTIARSTIVTAVALVIVVPVIAMVWVRTSWARGERVRIPQPVAFDHRLHAGPLRIDCRYCHAGADRSAWAGLPSTQQCVSCHSPLWMSSALLAPVRQSLATNKPIPWRRVTQLPDFVYFDHAIHVNKGVGCETCHGRVDRMSQAEQVAPLTMTWCVDCHRSPAPHLRPADAITEMGWTPPTSADSLGAALVERYHVRALTNCSTCHR
jgi:mono/diheme cytochrome c family protein